MAELENLKNIAVAAGFTQDFIAEVLEKLGPDALQLLVDGVKNGFSVDFVTQALKKLGPTVLQLILELVTHLTSTQSPVGVKVGAGELIQGEEVGILNGEIISIFVQKLLPVLLAKFGPQIEKLLLDWLTQFIQNINVKN